MLFCPVMVGTGAGLIVTASEEAVPLPQEFVPVTETLPEVIPKVTVILFVLVPDVMTVPGGTVQLYPVAFAIGGTE